MASLRQISFLVFANKYTHKPLNLSIYRAPRNTFRTTASSISQLKLSSNNNNIMPYESFCNHIRGIVAEEDNNAKHTDLVNQVRRLIAEVNNDDSLEDLIMVDALQRLAIDDHFRYEINSILRRRYLQYINNDLLEHLNLYQVSLCFRILRQNGYHLSADVFMKFKGSDNKFDDEQLNNDIRGLMELYEASQLRIQGETILDEAQDFCGYCLEKYSEYLDHNQVRTLRRTLKNPYHKTIPFFNYKNYIYDFNGTVLQELADMDFHTMQALHRMESNHILSWWNDLGLCKELSRSRNQPLIWYIGPMTALTYPSLSTQRINITKTISLVYTVDDIFDIYGTIDELTLFTDAINRWDRNATQQLPSYMQSTFRAIYDTENEIANKIYEQHGFNPIASFRKSWASLCNAFLEEAKWFASGHTLNPEEYLKMGIATSGIQPLLVHLFFLVGDGKSEERAQIIDGDDDIHIITSLSKLSRLFDDLAITEENLHDKDGSYIKCFLNEHKGTSLEIAHQHVFSLISEAWKDVNMECLSPNPFSTTFIKAMNNFARMMPFMTSYCDAASLSLLKDYIKALLQYSSDL